MKPFSLFLFFFLSIIALNLLAQNTKEFHIYQIQLGAFAKKPSLQEFDTLAPLGILNDQSIGIEQTNDGLTRLYLGKYLGDVTSQFFMQEVQNRGFKGVTLEEDVLTLEHSVGQSLEYTIQLGSFKELNILKFAKVPDLRKLYVRLQGDMFKVYYGFYMKEESLIAQNIIQELKAIGFEAILVKFR